ncbi:site-specific integrase [Streptomyces fildesensis]|uniref:site-specific integrase n=1 Tax=Streptomyces fildesensis TaxID=375757 RepID=UPI0018DFF31D|nr:site-specific integrase [Streptomyces fildesensis]
MTKRQDWAAGEEVRTLLTLLSELEPALGQEALLGAIGQAAARPDGRRRLARDVTRRPELLTGQGMFADSPSVLRFIDALVDAGASAVIVPSCPRCGKQRKLGPPVDGVRICHGCRAKARALPCGRCGKTRPTARRHDNGHPLCQNCWHQDPRSWKPCTGCGNNRRVAAVTPDGPVCQNCRPGHDLPCTLCGTTGSRIGISRAISKPVCERCRQRWIICSACGTGAVLKGGTLDKPLCASCLNPDPAFWKRCSTCRTTWQLSTAQCTRCSLDRKLKDIFAPPSGTTLPALDQLREALVQSDRPDSVDTWLTRHGVRTTLRDVARGRRRLSHDFLDTMPPSLTLNHLRAMLVVSGALPRRDELLAGLETWIDQALASRSLPEHHRALHGYAVWHQLRRLRGRLHGNPVTDQQARNLRQQITAATAFLDWLEDRELTLQTCTQADLDLWRTDHPGHRQRSANFVRWAVTHRHASRLTAPSTRWSGPAGPLDQDRRWSDARRLLHDDACPLVTRTAGLLVLLYAQKLSDITALTVKHVRHHGDRTFLHLGSRPIVLPNPLDELVDELVATRRPPGSGVLHEESGWLFPGHRRGLPLTEGALARRLHALGITPRHSRNTALFALAAELPAAILAKTLGIHIQSAVQWQKIAAGDWNSYAADISQRPRA